MPELSDNELMTAFNPEAIPYALAWVIGTFLGVKALNAVLEKISETSSRRLIIKQATAFISYSAYVISFIMAFTTLFTLSSKALFALSGTMAVVLGFALKDVASSFLAGLTILLTKPFQVGDRISFGGYYGEVKEIGLRSVSMVTLDDNFVTIPTNKILTDAVASANAGALDCMVVTKFFISPNSDHKLAQEIVREAVVSSKYLFLGKPVSVRIQQLLSEDGRSVVQITTKAYVFDMRHENDFTSDITDRTLTSFKRHNISFAGAN